MNIQTSLQSIVVPVKSNDKSSLQYYREQIFYMLNVITLVAGTAAYIFSIYYSLLVKAWAIVFLDTLIYLLAILIATIRSIPYNLRVSFYLFFLFILGSGLYVILGKAGAGTVWFFCLPLLAVLLLPQQNAYIVVTITYLTLGIFGLSILYQVPVTALSTDYSAGEWLINSINFIAANLIVIAGMIMMNKGIEKILKKERKLNVRLGKEKSKLMRMKTKAEAADNLKSAFLANMSHEIRTPLNAIMGFSGLLMEKHTEEHKREKYAGLIYQSSERLMNLINDIIDLSKLEAKQLRIIKKKFELVDFLDKMMPVYQQLLVSYKKEHIELTLDKPVNSLWVLTDPDRLAQILINLVSNAIKFTISGSVKLGFNLSEAPKNVNFYVEDTGTGIPDGSKKYIFERFMQVSAPEHNLVQGTGLGLAITKSLVELLGGTIGFNSSKKGTKFYFSVPVE